MSVDNGQDVQIFRNRECPAIPLVGAAKGKPDLADFPQIGFYPDPYKSCGLSASTDQTEIQGRAMSRPWTSTEGKNPRPSALSIHPLETLMEEFELLCVSPTEFSRQIGVPPNRVSQFHRRQARYEQRHSAEVRAPVPDPCRYTGKVGALISSIEFHPHEAIGNTPPIPLQNWGDAISMTPRSRPKTARSSGRKNGFKLGKHLRKTPNKHPQLAFKLVAPIISINPRRAAFIFCGCYVGTNH
jgi:hypothetical protein